MNQNETMSTNELYELLSKDMNSKIDAMQKDMNSKMNEMNSRISKVQSEFRATYSDIQNAAYATNGLSMPGLISTAASVGRSPRRAVNSYDTFQ